MKGKRIVEDPVTGPPVHQQQRNGEFNYSPTTPAWNITDTIVKSESPEDTNNDSGVSPGHYTSNSVSPSSRSSSSMANGSLSPASATSQDSSATLYEYSPQSVSNSSYSGVGFPHAKGARSSKSSAAYKPKTKQRKKSSARAKQPVDMVSSTMKPENDQPRVMQCPICPFVTVNRLHFTEHLTTHSSSKSSTPEVPNTSSYAPTSSVSEDGARASPSQGERSEQESDEVEEPGMRVPRINCQGKVKTFRCKQCNYVAITKLEFWDHSRGHIKAEKLLTCPKCPFVTEYKHHLEYHLRNHFGSKPFKCDKCPYSCVNKSMLNSHLKSHSNIYQYRCAECSYASKYCHSLKLHLRKYAHQPAMVLNPDGSPNPLPIIDIYGTRRGPKQKASKTAGSSGKKMAGVSSAQIQVNPFVVEQHRHQQVQMGLQQLNYGQLLSAVNLPVNFLQQFHGNKNEMLKSEGLKPFEFFARDNQQNFGAQRDAMVISPSSSSAGSSTSPEPPAEEAPLDLSKPEVAQSSKTKPAKNGRTSRRKGKAFKLDKLMVADESDGESSDSVSNPAIESPVDPILNAQQPMVSQENTLGGAALECYCPYCELGFGNVVMYTLHMGYHGYKNPYECNLCGYECFDKVSFFLHIAKSSHL
ncbi:protein hunchback-like [Neodiprion lecontei]|uniref:Protein hunchback n=1 Tax=Neodiprion lecontei TaxID=441921 RepID=A0A6J0BYC3_NEOLC|nr:protein hunchback-like [Neodiprion lecontei]